MRNLIVWVLLPAVIVQGCASTATSSPSAASPAPAKQATAPSRVNFQAINDELEGDAATVELAGGEVVQKAQSVVLGPQTTSWRDPSGRERSVPTAEVRRVLREQRHMAGKGFGFGAMATSVPAYFAVQNSRNSNSISNNAALALLIGIPLGGLIGMLVAVSLRRQVVVYAAPAAPAEASTVPAAGLHCRLLSPADGGRLACQPASR